uniref:Golgi SNAP receptor complex member 1 n=1 Tax=Hucho hucho TaxID=62062 RepID=A0A4W5Q5P8_9TELE
MAGGSSNYWEDLRKQARQLENELDLKLVSFSKLCTSYTTSRDGRRGDSNSDTAPLLNNSTQDRMFETMSVEIEQLLAKLTGVNDKMAEYTSTPGVTSLNAALMHTLQRHRDILQDYTHEFHKTKANFLAIREREDLLGSVRKDIETYKSGSGVNNRRTELFLKEHEHLRKYDPERTHTHTHTHTHTLLLTFCAPKLPDYLAISSCSILQVPILSSQLFSQAFSEVLINKFSVSAVPRAVLRGAATSQ